MVASVDAGLLAAAVVLLSRPRAAHKLAAFLIGCMGFSIGFGLIIVLALHGSRVLRHADPHVTAIVEVAVGGLLIVVAVVAVAGRAWHWRPRRRSDDEEGSQRHSLSDRALGHDSLWVAWAAGALYSVPGAYYLAGLALLIKLDKPAAIDALAVVGFNIVMFAFIELPLLGFLLAPERARTRTARFSDWITRHKRTVITVVAGAGRRVPARVRLDRPPVVGPRTTTPCLPRGPAQAAA
jgi:threonine/homoserine/homoserine lactone efflux protein